MPSALATPHPSATPAGPRPTPVAPDQYKRADLLKHDSTDYAKLRHRAEAINAAVDQTIFESAVDQHCAEGSIARCGRSGTA